MRIGKILLVGAMVSLAAGPVLAQGRGNSGGNANANANVRAGGVHADTHVNADVQGNSALGNLNAAHASENARAHANANSTVGHIGSYETDMKAALAISNQTQRNAAITRARQQLAQTANKPLTAGAITQLDSELGIRGASPRLGAER